MSFYHTLLSLYIYYIAKSDYNPKHAAATGVAFAELVREQLEEKQRLVFLSILLLL
jgi:hypothetical protein